MARTIAGAAVTSFVYDGDRLVEEYDGGGARLRRYAHGVGVDEPLVWYEGADLSGRRFLHHDHQGSVIAATAGAATTLLASYGYDAYGVPKDNIWTGSRFRYTGQIALPEARLYHYKARVYDPVLGRFLQTDPIGYKDQFNLYAYVGDDPLNHGDPSGTQTAKAYFDAIFKNNPVPSELAHEVATDAISAVAEHPGETLQIAGDAITIGSAVAGQPEGVAAGRAVSGLGSLVKAGGPRASAPVGRRDSTPVGGGKSADPAGWQRQLNVKRNDVPSRNAPGDVNGRQYSGHAFDRMQDRGMTPTVVEDTIANGSPHPGDGSILYHHLDNGTTVIVDANSGRVITAY